ncbi:MAG: type VI secretion system-associated protein TagF [Rhizobacter sp.]
MSAAAVNGATVPGWFGKLPNLGDFASRRLPDTFVHRWDRWLQAGLARARDDDGDWLRGYLVAPIRRFWLAPGVLGSGGWAGVLMPSVDRVGRHFPLTLAGPLEPLGAALAARTWYDELDAAARRVLDLDYTVDDFELALADLPAPNGAEPDAQACRLADDLAATQEARTVWWCVDAELPADFHCFAALPAAPALAAMLGAAR